MAEKLQEKHGQGLTQAENEAIIAKLVPMGFEQSEQKLMSQVLLVQILVTLMACLVVLVTKKNPELVVTVLCGGGASVINSFLLIWRMSKSTAHVTLDAHLHLRTLYYYAAERFLVVVVLLAVFMLGLKLSPLWLLGGFVLGQVVFVTARLVLTRFNNLR